MEAVYREREKKNSCNNCIANQSDHERYCIQWKKKHDQQIYKVCNFGGGIIALVQWTNRSLKSHPKETKRNKMKTKLLAQYFPTGVSVPLILLALILRLVCWCCCFSLRSIPYIGDLSFHSPNIIAHDRRSLFFVVVVDGFLVLFMLLLLLIVCAT